MAWLTKVGRWSCLLEVFPFEAPKHEVDIPQSSGVPRNLISGEFAWIDAKLCAIYGSEGKLWIRVDTAEFFLTEPLAVKCRYDGKSHLVTTIPHLGDVLEVREPVPSSVLWDPTFDGTAEEDTFWGMVVYNATKSKRNLDQFWGNARHLR